MFEIGATGINSCVGDGEGLEGSIVNAVIDRPTAFRETVVEGFLLMHRKSLSV